MSGRSEERGSFPRSTGSSLSKTGTAWPMASSPAAVPADLLLRSQYQSLTRKHLSRVFEKLIAEYTGLNFHIAWAPAGSHDWDLRRLPTGCSACCRFVRNGVPSDPLCQTCGSKQLARALKAGAEGLFFECPRGVLNYWLSIRIRDLTVGIAYLQALDARKPLLQEQGRRQSTRAALGIMTRPELHRAARLLHLVVDYLQALDLADLRKAELSNAGHAVVALEREQVRLHEALKRHLPAPPLIARRSASASHGEEAVQQLLGWVAQNYSQPITLQACAAKLGMNVAYLSTLFSRAVGIPFKTYLTEFRLRKAKTLLGDLNHTVSEVAYAVGYSNENRFRAMFKKATGLAPGTWRETLRAQSVAILGFLFEAVEQVASLELPCLG